MNSIAQFIRDLEAVEGDFYDKATVAAEFFLSTFPEGDRIPLRAALDAAAVLRCFDATLLMHVLFLSKVEAEDQFKILKNFPFVEHFPNQVRELRSINQPTRIGWRKKLSREQPDRFRQLSGRAAACFAGFLSSKEHIEWIYHLLYADYDNAIVELGKLEQKWIIKGSETDPYEEDRYILLAVLKEFDENKPSFIVEKEAAYTTSTSQALPSSIEKLRRKRESGEFDVFLCHNSDDKPTVQELAERLKMLGILPWLDIWELRPGMIWQRLLEEQIKNIKSVAVFVGPAGLGPWQSLEIEAFLRAFVKRSIPIIPVMLPNALLQPNLPPFLEGFGWVDFRKNVPDPMKNLLWGITGVRPEDQ